MKKNTFNYKNISKAEGEPELLLGILLIKAVKVYTAVQAELLNNSIENSKEALALIKGNGDNINKVNAVNKLD